MVSFLFLIDYAARLLRPVRLVALVCDQGLDVIRSVYPEAERAGDDGEGAAPTAQPWPARTRRTEARGGRRSCSRVGIEALVEGGAALDGVIELVPQVGDFVAADEPLFNLHGGAAGIDDAFLRDSVVFGTERTMEQDPTFAFRILVDIAIKALSPAINDPTTAVLAIDQIHRLLRVVGRRQLHGDAIRDAAGRVRLILRTPNWDDFVHIACNEIRACGAGSVQIARRLRAMLENLVRTLPATRHAALLRAARPARPDAAGLLQAPGGPRAGAHPGLAGPRRRDGGPPGADAHAGEGR